MKAQLDDIIANVSTGRRLGADEYLLLYEQADFHALCSLAHQIRTRMHGNTVYYIKNAHINYTNVCTCQCPVCTFSKRSGEPGGYTRTIAEIKEIAQKSAAGGVREFHVVGGLNPELPYSYYLDIVATLRTAAPAAAVKAFTAVEIDFIAGAAGKSVETVLNELRTAGLGCLPGGGAEVFAPEHREKNFPNKISAARWLEIHHTAHRLGIPTTATMLYGHTETPAQRIEHLLALRQAQEQSIRDFGIGFMCFVPLAYREPNNTPVQAVLDISTMAISRIILDNILHIKAFCPILGDNVAQVGLFAGADDIDGMPENYEIVKDSQGRRDADRMLKDVSASGLVPVERDSYYERVGS